MKVKFIGKHVKDGFSKPIEKEFNSLDDARAFAERSYSTSKDYVIGSILNAKTGKVIGEVVYGKYELVSTWTNKPIMTTNSIAYISYNHNAVYSSWGIHGVIKYSGKIDSAYHFRKV